MTDNEIIKALESWVNNFDGTVGQFTTLCASLNLIKRQKAEIEEKRETSFYLAQKVNEKDAEIERLNNCVTTEEEVRRIAKETIIPMVAEAETEAIKGFAEVVMSYAETYNFNFGGIDCKVKAVRIEHIANLANGMEMKEETK